MKFKLSGSTSGLRKYAEKLRAAGSDTVLRRLSDNIAEEGLSLIEEAFATETSPDGDKWAPKVFSDGRQVLVGSTTRLRRGWHRKYISAGGFALAPSVTYAKYQFGTGIYGPRHAPIRPTSAKALSFKVQTARSYKSGAVVSVGRGRGHNWKSSRVFFSSVKGAPPRRMIPAGKRLPEKWQRAFRAAAHDFWQSYFAKR